MFSVGHRKLSAMIRKKQLHWDFWNVLLKVHIFWEGHKNFAKSSPNFWLQYIRSKVRRRFRKILWPSQNIWTLPTLVFKKEMAYFLNLVTENKSEICNTLFLVVLLICRISLWLLKRKIFLLKGSILWGAAQAVNVLHRCPVE